MMSGKERLSSARIALAGILAVTSWTFSSTGARAADLSDTTPPTLEAADSGFAPSAIDVTTDPATVTIRLRITDDLSGVSFTPAGAGTPQAATFYSPSFAQSKTVYGYEFSLVSGTPMDGVWEAQVEFPAASEAGTWRLYYLELYDTVGNRASLDYTTLENLGFNTSLEVTSNPDLQPPSLVSFDIDPLTVDTSSGVVFADVIMQLADDSSGVDLDSLNTWSVGFLSPDSRFVRPCVTPQLESGTPLAGTYRAQCYFPQYSQQGNWPVYHVLLGDRAGNTVSYRESDLAGQGFPSGLALISDPSDTQLFEIKSFDFLPKFIDTTVGDANVAGTMSASDDISGVSGLQATFRSPSGGQQRQLNLFRLTAGTALDGTFTGTMFFPQFSEAGTWKLESVFYYDRVFNYAFLTRAQFEALGFPTVLNVVLPSADTDGQIGPDGGTVQDAVFGARASLTLPPGAVAGTTNVAIDVIQSALDFEMPQGFGAPGSRFVNIKFDPVPMMPFPAPGATVVLPLVNPLPAGSSLTLFRVDPGTGDLVPAVAVGGGPVIGTVAGDGLSATFAGVGQFSVVVGLIADNVAPTVIPPADATVLATSAQGATPASSPTLTSFLAGGSATDNLDPNPRRLSPQLGGVDVTGSTVFPIGTSTVTFSFEDDAQNVGQATASVSVVVGRPKIAATVIAKSTPASGQRLVTIRLANSGTGHARDVMLNSIVLRTLSGSGTVTLAGPALPIAVGNVDAGTSTNVALTLNVPATVTRFSITENGTVKDVTGTKFGFSAAQAVFP